ncbi:hypothetical protein [Streptomyces sp. MUM 203J]|nr:hypothetical protein [Streptomyces sp. MUM 203J]
MPMAPGELRPPDGARGLKSRAALLDSAEQAPEPLPRPGSAAS